MLAVFVGGGAGSLARHFLSSYLNGVKSVIPWGTFTANFASCLILGIFLGLEMKNATQIASMRLLIITGFCGGFSTFSTFSAETLNMLQNQKMEQALVYMIGSFGLCLLGVLAGTSLINLLK
jgi:CrcB protein